MHTRLSRRKLLATTAALAPAGVLGRGSAAETVIAGLIGCGGRGQHLARALLGLPGRLVRFAGVADPDRKHRESVAAMIAGKQERDPAAHVDYRRILDDPSVDVVFIATPDHWHAIGTLHACQAGKDVYVEKPCSHNVREGRAMVTAARKHQRIVQVGQHRRSDPAVQEAVRYLKDKRPLGTITRTRTMNFANEPRFGIGSPPDRPRPPDGVDYDLWLGPAPKRPFNPNRFHQHFRWFFDYAGGMVCDWNVHLHDIVHLAMGVTAPQSVYATGGKRIFWDNRETPDVMDVVYAYPGFTQVYSMSKVYHKGQYGESYGTEFLGTNGSMFLNWAGWKVSPATATVLIEDPDHPGKTHRHEEPRTPPIDRPGRDSVVPHLQNFLATVRSRRSEELTCDIESAHHTATACHLANISYHLGRQIWWDAEKEQILRQDGQPDAEANQHLGREYRKGYEL